MNREPVIVLENLSKKYRLYKNHSERLLGSLSPFHKHKFQEFYALKDFNLKAYQGDIIGILGINGSGKSTLLKLVSGILTPTTGNVRVRGKVAALLELGTGFHPELTGLENIYFYTTLLGFKRKDIHFLVEKIIDFAEIGEFIDQPLKLYSTGMKSRLAFSVSTFIDPEVLIVDEVLAVGDEYFKEKSKKKMAELFNSGKTILMVSHSVKDIRELCNRALLMSHGQMMIEGTPDEVTTDYIESIKQ